MIECKDNEGTGSNALLAAGQIRNKIRIGQCWKLRDPDAEIHGPETVIIVPNLMETDPNQILTFVIRPEIIEGEPFGILAIDLVAKYHCIYDPRGKRCSRCEAYIEGNGFPGDIIEEISRTEAILERLCRPCSMARLETIKVAGVVHAALETTKDRNE